MERPASGDGGLPDGDGSGDRDPAGRVAVAPFYATPPQVLDQMGSLNSCGLKVCAPCINPRLAASIAPGVLPQRRH